MNTTNKKTKIKLNSKDKDIKKVSKSKENLKIKNKQTVTQFSYISFMDKLSFEYVKELYKSYMKKKTYFMVIMYLRNGKFDMFTISTLERSFTKDGATYFIDPDFFKHNSHTGTPVIFYHQDVCTPFKIEFDIDKLFKEVAETNPEVELALNPNSLKGFINSQVIEKVLKGQELTEDMAFMKKLIIINLLVNGLIGAVILKQMGVF